MAGLSLVSEKIERRLWGGGSLLTAGGESRSWKNESPVSKPFCSESDSDRAVVVPVSVLEAAGSWDGNAAANRGVANVLTVEV